MIISIVEARSIDFHIYTHELNKWTKLCDGIETISWRTYEQTSKKREKIKTSSERTNNGWDGTDIQTDTDIIDTHKLCTYGRARELTQISLKYTPTINQKNKYITISVSKKKKIMEINSTAKTKWKLYRIKSEPEECFFHFIRVGESECYEVEAFIFWFCSLFLSLFHSICRCFVIKLKFTVVFHSAVSSKIVSRW